MRPVSIPQRSCRPTTAWTDLSALLRRGAENRSLTPNRSRTLWRIWRRCANRKMKMRKSEGSTRRQFLGIAGTAAAIGTVPVVSLRPVAATPETMTAAIRNVIGSAAVRIGKVKLDVPPLVENGNTVPMTITVSSPNTAEDHVKSIHVFNEKNPQPNIGNFYLGPRAGRGQISTRIRLADSQKITAIARMSDDSLWSATADVVVTL